MIFQLRASTVAGPATSATSTAVAQGGPFLKFDSDPYRHLQGAESVKSRPYTTTSRYPDSAADPPRLVPRQRPDLELNYVPTREGRHDAKTSPDTPQDAFYIVDQGAPMIQGLQEVFPSCSPRRTTLSPLKAHFRLPGGHFRVRPHMCGGFGAATTSPTLGDL